MLATPSPALKGPERGRPVREVTGRVKGTGAPRPAYSSAGRRPPGRYSLPRANGPGTSGVEGVSDRAPFRTDSSEAFGPRMFHETDRAARSLGAARVRLIN